LVYALQGAGGGKSLDWLRMTGYLLDLRFLSMFEMTIIVFSALSVATGHKLICARLNFILFDEALFNDMLDSICIEK